MFSREEVLVDIVPRYRLATKGAGGVVHYVSTSAGVFKRRVSLGKVAPFFQKVS
jgi:hypothetical protein